MKNWRGNKRTIFSSLGATNHSDYQRAKQDYYATNPDAIDDLFFYEKFDKNIWECACGEGHLSERMKKYGKNVYSTDLVNRGYGDDFFDFLTQDKSWEGDIITNPPYRWAEDFVRKAIKSVEKGNKVAMFLKLLFLESIGRVNLFEKYPPRFVYVYSFRQTAARNGQEEMFSKSSAVCYAWFIWEKGIQSEPIIRWIKPRKKQNSLFLRERER